MNILITRTKRKKTISIQVKNGNIEVKAPFSLNHSCIMSFIQKKDNMFKKFSLEIDLSRLVISDKMFVGKDLINMELKDHKKFLCKEF